MVPDFMKRVCILRSFWYAHSLPILQSSLSKKNALFEFFKQNLCSAAPMPGFVGLPEGDEARGQATARALHESALEEVCLQFGVPS